MSEPVAKKSRTSEKSDVPIVVHMSGDHRTLCVGNTKFTVPSEKLTKNSEYFRVMFDGDFAEKDQTEITIKDVDPGHMDLFLTAMINPDKLEINGDNLKVIIRLCVYFQSNEYFFNLLGRRKFSEKCSLEDLLSMMEEFPELKDNVDKLLSTLFLVQYPVNIGRKKSRMRACDFKFSDLILKSLKLASDRSFSNLKDVVDAELAAQYKTINHFVCVHAQYNRLMKKYKLSELMKAIEEHVIAKYNKGQHTFNELKSIWKATHEMKNIQMIIENHYADEFKQTSDALDYKDLSNYLVICKDYELSILKVLVEDCFKEKFSKKQDKSDHEAVANLLLICKNHELHNFRDFIENYLILKCEQMEEGSKNLSIKDLHSLADIHDHSFTQLKTAIENHYMSDSDKKKHELEYYYINRFLVLSRQYEMNDLKDSVQSYLVLKCENMANEETKLSTEELFRLTFDRELPALEDHVQNLLVEDFNAEKNWVYFVELLIEYNLPNFKKVVEEYLFNPLQETNDVGLETVAKDHRFNRHCRDFGYFKDTLNKYFIRQFNATHNFKHVDLAFGRQFVEYKECIVDFLKKASLDDPIMVAASDHILKLGKGAKSFILETLLRKPSDPSDD